MKYRKTFPLADNVSLFEIKKIMGEEISIQESVRFRLGVRAIPTGEVRSPKKGEWYLSGVIVEGYKANGDFEKASYKIAKLVLTKNVRMIVDKIEFDFDH